jgi:hypothetical protein
MDQTDWDHESSDSRKLKLGHPFQILLETVVNRTIVVAFILIFSLNAFAGNTNAVPPKTASDKPEIVAEGAGTLRLRKVKNGYLAEFKSDKPLSTTCSGSCSGVSVGSWSCSDSYPYCGLDCTKRPPYKWCYKE